MERVCNQTPADAMEPDHETSFPMTLCQWVSEIVQSSPEAARLTLLELIVGALLASGGHVTQAILALTPRPSAQAPGVAVRFDHAAKTNRPMFLLCQGFVTLSAVVPCRDRPRSVPLVTGLCRSSGNAGKLAIAKGLLRAVGALGPVCLLLDAWYMRGSLIRTALRLGHEVIGQVRRDTALFALPPPRQPGRRGRSRLYGTRLDVDTVAALPASVHAIAGYGGRSAPRPPP